MAAIQILAVTFAALVFRSEAAFFGGASSFSLFANDIVSGFNAKTSGSDIPAYAAVGSAAGVAGFLSGTYSVGASDAPLSPSENIAADNLVSNGKKGKLTIPICLSTFTFATKKSSKVKITAAQVAGIYKGTVTAWSALVAGGSGNIVPVARSDGSGSTNVINRWIVGTVPSWKFVGDATWQGKAGVSSSVIFVKGSGNVASTIAADSDRIGYLITGYAISKGLFQSAIKNPAGVYLLATDATPTQSIPRSLPKSAGSWSGVTLVNAAGVGTFPIVSFEYTFVKIGGGFLVKNFMTYTQTSDVQNLLSTKYDNQFFRLPAALTGQNVAAIKTIS